MSSPDGGPPKKYQKMSKDTSATIAAAAASAMSSAMSASLDSFDSNWDPNRVSGPLPAACLSRVTREMLDLITNPLPGITAVQDEDDMGKVHALLVGPSGTPYEGGYFYLVLRVTDQYPMKPPKARLVTTGDGQVRFNPNLYKNGKVCLSILGTWRGPCWTPALGLRSVLLSVQSLMNERPYRNEPGYESSDGKKCAIYNEIIRHETVRVAVCDMMEGRVQLPQPLAQEMRSKFGEHYDYYAQLCRSNLAGDGKQMRDPFGDSRPKFCYGSLLRRLEDIQRRLNGGGAS